MGYPRFYKEKIRPMTELLRFPQPDGSTKVIDPTTGNMTFENVPKPVEPTGTPFGRPHDDLVFQNVQAPADDKPFRIKEGTAEEIRVNADAPKAPEPDMVSQQAAAATEKQKAPEYPPGTPELQSLLRLDFKERSRAMKLYQGAIDAWGRMPQLGTVLDTFDKLDRYFEGLAAFKELLLAVAVSPDEFMRWSKNVDDNEFASLFFIYVTRFSLGEA